MPIEDSHRMIAKPRKQSIQLALIRVVNAQLINRTSGGILRLNFAARHELRHRRHAHSL
jgi:hypothetical protein